jgi:hypothetical protein
VNSPRKGRDREREETGLRARKASTGLRPSTGSASRARKAASRPSSGSRATGLASRARKAASREAAASRPSTDGGVEGGGGIEAEHWVEGEEGSVEGGVDVGMEADKWQCHRHKGKDYGLRGAGKLGSLTASRGNSMGLGFAGPGGTRIYTRVVVHID